VARRRSTHRPTGDGAPVDVLGLPSRTVRISRSRAPSHRDAARRSEMPVLIRLAPDGRRVTGPPKKHRTNRVFIEGSPRDDGYPVSLAGLQALRDSADARWEFAAGATSFREFLNVWRFLDQESGVERTPGGRTLACA
jgi:hypothetical protein